jgi:hypothetical protein
LSPEKNSLDSGELEVKRTKSANDIIVPSAKIALLEAISTKKYGFGSIYKANYNKSEVCVRNIKFDRLSRYDLEGLQKDMEEIA